MDPYSSATESPRAAPEKRWQEDGSKRPAGVSAIHVLVWCLYVCILKGLIVPKRVQYVLSSPGGCVFEFLVSCASNGWCDSGVGSTGRDDGDLQAPVFHNQHK